MTFPVVGSNIPTTYQISNSLRFNQGDTAHLDKTFSSAGTSNKIGTLSFWYKRTTVGNVDFLFHVYPNRSGHSNDRTLLAIGSDNKLVCERIFQGSTQFQVKTTQLFRDVSAWYHCIIVFDTTQSTASDRLKMYLNGSQITDFSTTNYPGQNVDIDLADAHLHTVGAGYNGSYIHPLDGYLAEYHYIDGTAKSPTDFGESDENSGVWKPKQYAGTYGTNGFYLKFNNSGNMGEDSSGNDNTFTPTNLSGPTDVTTDTPTNNFATMNSLESDRQQGGAATFAEGNLEITTSYVDSNYQRYPQVYSTQAASSGKWYFEMKITTSDTDSFIGIHSPDNYASDSTTNPYGGYASTGCIYTNNGEVRINDGQNGGHGTFSQNDILGCALDIDNNKVYFHKNGTYIQSGVPASGTGGQAIPSGYRYGFTVGSDNASNSGTMQVNFGNPPFSISSGNTDDNGYGNFEYAPPSGYLALCTQNLATALSPTIDDGSQYFNTITYTANRTARSLTGVGFQPDWVWIKDRGGAQNHALFDSNRGVNKQLRADVTDAELTAYSDTLTSFDSDGFSLGADASVGDVNYDLQPHVAWNWKANGGTTSSNTDGSITSTVQANTTAGFSIITYTGTGANATVGHGLGVAPAMTIHKRRDSTSGWLVYHQGYGATKYTQLNSTDATTTASFAWNDTEPTSSVISLGYAGGNNASGGSYVAYCFADIEGYSKFGSYTGNGNSDGVFVYTGFRPAFFIGRRVTSTSNWLMYDSKRNTFNDVNLSLYPSLSNAEATQTNNNLDFLSNGFKIRGSGGTLNGSGSTIIYMAFAENPFVTSGAVPVTAR